MASFHCKCKLYPDGHNVLKKDRILHNVTLKRLRDADIDAETTISTAPSLHLDSDESFSSLVDTMQSMNLEASQSVPRRVENSAKETSDLMTALTLTDEGPNLSQQQSKLWSSSQEVHMSASTKISAQMRDVPLAEAQKSFQLVIEDSFRQTALHNKPPPTRPSRPIRACRLSTSSSKAAPSGASRPKLRSPTVSPAKPQSAWVRKSLQITGSVKEVATQILVNLNFPDGVYPAHECLRLLLESTSKTVRDASESLRSVTNSTPEVVEDKQKAVELLREANGRISFLGATLPPVAPPTAPVFYDTTHVYANPVAKLDVIAQLAILLGVLSHVILGLSRNICDFLVASVVMMVKLAMATRLATGDDGTPQYDGNQKIILEQLPSSLYTALNRLNVDGRTTLYAACPSCNFTHEPTYEVTSPSIARYPDHCINRLLGPDGRYTCGAELLESRQGQSRPIKPFLSASFVDYVARALSDEQTEQLCNQACDDAFSTIGQAPQEMRNVFQGEFMRNFEGPEPGKLFIDRGDRIRLAFAIHVDFFNPNRTTHRGNHDSIGIISLVNLALPESIRYLPENIFIVGIIPGRFEPPAEQLNHYVRPVLEEAEVGWRRGFRMSRTALKPEGADVDVAIILSVNDLPAARKVSGTAGHASHFYCTVCKSYDRETLYRTDFEAWTPRDDAEMRRHAENWRDAETLSEREAIFKSYGVRWSEMWRLPYWRPSRMLVIDSMHCILEGLVHYHCRHVLGLSSHQASAKDPVLPAFSHSWLPYDPSVPPEYRVKTPTEISHIAVLQTALCLPLEDSLGEDPVEKLRRKLLTKNLAPLKYLCYSLGLSLTLTSPEGLPISAKNKKHFADLLINWRNSKPLTSEDVSPKTITPATMEHIQNVISKTITPSWINSVPANYGENSAGSIKADEWRTLSTIYLPIALVTLWGDIDGTPPKEESQHMKILNHSMSLFQAVGIVCRYSMTKRRAIQYRNLIKEWVDGLHTVHPHTTKHQRRPNVHASFHIHDFLLLFGPVTSWWCFPFERLIGTIQKINTNDEIGGTLESTILKSHMRGANLRRWLRRPDCPEVIRQFKALFDKALCTDKVKQDSSDDDAAVWRLPEVAHFTHKGVTYSRASTHLENSLISYYPCSVSSKPVIGSIQKISSSGKSVYFTVRRQAPLPANKHDPFLRYPAFPASVYSSHMSNDAVDTITVSLVLSHVARFEFSNDRAVIINLSRV